MLTNQPNFFNSHSIKGCVANEIQHAALPEEGTTMNVENWFKQTESEIC